MPRNQLLQVLAAARAYSALLPTPAEKESLRQAIEQLRALPIPEGDFELKLPTIEIVGEACESCSA